MNISEVSKKYDISLDTLRYYEKIGLLPPIARDKNGRRIYSEKDLRWIEIIKCLRSVGISIETLIEYTNLCNQGDDTLEERKNILLEKRDALIESIKSMEEVLDKLNYKIENYDKGILSKKI